MTDLENFDDFIDDPDAQELEVDNNPESGIQENDVEGLTEHLIDDDTLSISDDDLQNLEDKAAEIDRSEADKSQISFGRKMCPTRHGCQGATDCNYSYGGYPG